MLAFLLACLLACLLAWLIGWVVDWLVAWFVGWLHFCLFASLLALNVQLTLAWLELAGFVLGLVACTSGYSACLFTCFVY